MTDLKYVGKPLPRLDALEKVTGRALFPGDLNFPGMLHAKVLFSSEPHALIKRIDTSKAEKVSGVVKILTHKDVPVNEYGIYIFDQQVLAEKKVRSVGDPLALVIAEDPHSAEEARDLIEVEYEPLPGVFDPKEALKAGAPLVHEEAGTNLLKEFNLNFGDVESAMKRADVVLDLSFSTPFNEHAYLQPEAAVGMIDEQGRVTVFVASQWIHDDIRQIAHALALPEDRVREVLMEAGGTFGGREDISLQILVALAAYKTGKPVKLVYTREESIRGHGKRHPFYMNGKIGVTREGRVVAMDLDLISDAGAYASTSIVVLANAVSYANGPYDVPNVRVRGRTVYTNNIMTMAMRGFGSAQVPMIYEGLIDEACRKLNMDPVEFRMRNLLDEGSILPTGYPIPPGVGIKETLKKAAFEAGWKLEDGKWVSPPRKKGEGGKLWGRGVACVYKNVGYSFGFDDHAHVVLEARVSPDGKIEELQVKVGSTDSGQGIRTTLCQIAAEATGVPLEKISFVRPDTSLVGSGGSNSASRSVFVTGRAILEAARELKKEIDRGKRGLVRGEFFYRTQTVRPTTPFGPDGKCIPHQSYGYTTNIVELEVDPDLGTVEVKTVIGASDLGKAINPDIVEGQIGGGVLMGLSYALMEDFVLQEGRIKTPNLSTYIIPTSKDIPEEVKPIIVEVSDPAGPFGAKGVGELTMIGVAPAVLNALRDATSLRFTKIPVLPEDIKTALKDP
ncbi:MAG: xanthine dehydrogenase family protein molybdopterin-binding subunit [Caldiserica bacterium]|jgi:CO/xanthine dehydrogenase Mo-binding subunit|nr:xanthine dehydrogenase family protein molybdopterin-binding subunit [Caldisericota bacterium]MDH7562578.1 xanthine dehydrogenase family protein molybdopterin-binding subunit [Caldisericota bacterium]